jgi:hypothetical protein
MQNSEDQDVRYCDDHYYDDHVHEHVQGQLIFDTGSMPVLPILLVSLNEAPPLVNVLQKHTLSQMTGYWYIAKYLVRGFYQLTAAWSWLRQ